MRNIILFLKGIAMFFLVLIFGIGANIIRYFIFPFKKTVFEKHETLQKSWQFFIWLTKIFRVIKLNIDDLEKIKGLRNKIIVSTHPTFIDIVILMSIIPYSTCFVAEKLSKNPVLKGLVNSLFITEGRPLNEWLNEASDKMDSGLNIIVFPMGRRHKPNEYLKIRRGTALIAQRTKKDIAIIRMTTNKPFLGIGEFLVQPHIGTVDYDIQYIGEIDTKKYLNIYSDEVSFKTVVGKELFNKLYDLEDKKIYE